MMAMLQALVVDDDKNSLRALAALVAELGFAPHTAGSLREARGRLLAEPPDVVLLDLVLPDGTGFDLIEDLKRQADRAEIVVIPRPARVSPARGGPALGACDH